MKAPGKREKKKPKKSHPKLAPPPQSAPRPKPAPAPENPQ